MNSHDEKRERRLRLVEDHIGRSLAESERNGELKNAPSFGRPLNFGDGYAETPEELRMGFKILKDGGFFPPQVELMRDIEALSRSIVGATNEEDIAKKTAQLSEMRLKLRIDIERLRG